jgi:glucose/arabinose dehydrogenase
MATALLAALSGAGAAQARPTVAATRRASPPPRCDRGNAGLTLPPGFCALVFADLGRARPRHLAVAPNGDVYVATLGRRAVPAGVVALRDTSGDGRADVQQLFGPGAGSGIAISGGWLYFAPDNAVYRWRLGGTLVPAGEPQAVVTGLPDGGHTAKSIALDGRGSLYVNIGSNSNTCELGGWNDGGPGRDPCPELATRAGIWRFDANRLRQTPADGVRWASGIRNAMGLAVDAQGRLFATQHGRDALHRGWPSLFTERKSAENPGEEFLAVNRGDVFGWPYCFYDVDRGRLVLAPEYGGHGRDTGRCASRKAPLMAFPGHWAPEALLFYGGTGFPARYRGGAFISFHGSWDRYPLPQAGFRVVYQPMRDGRPNGPYQTFADVGRSGHRPMGLAVGPDGSLYISDDAVGVIWRVYWTGAV